MSVEGLPPVSPHSASMLAPVSAWGARLVAPLGASAMSKEGMMEIVGRVYLIVVLVIAAAIIFVAKYTHLLGRATASGAATAHPAGKNSPEPTSFSGTASISFSGTASITASTNPLGTTSPEPTPSGSVSLSSTSAAGSAAEPAQQMIEALDGINRQFDALFLDLKQLQVANGIGAAIEKSLQECHQRFDRYKSSSEFLTYFKGLDYVESNFRFLKAMRESLFLAPIRMNDKGIIPQPPDGNCLYHSLGEGLRLLRESLISRGAWVEEPLNHEYLRDKVVTWMRRNINTDNDLQGYLDRAVGDYIEVRKGQYRDQREGLEALRLMGEDTSVASVSLRIAEEELSALESLGRSQKHQWYLTEASKLKFFASVAEMYAFSKLYRHVSVHVWRELGNRYTDSFDVPFNQSDLTINIAYNLSGDHFSNYVPNA